MRRAFVGGREVFFAMWLVGCGSPNPPSDTNVDLLPPRPACPAPGVTSLPACAGWPIPAGGCRVAELDTAGCDEGAPAVQIGPHAQCMYDATIVFSWAGWCGYCQQVAAKVPGLLQRYRGKSVRIVANLTSTADAKPPTTDFCGKWRAQYNLTGVDLGLDPQQHTVSTVLREQAVIDRHGRLRHAFDRSDTIIDEITAEVDALLADPD